MDSAMEATDATVVWTGPNLQIERWLYPMVIGTETALPRFCKWRTPHVFWFGRKQLSRSCGVARWMDSRGYPNCLTDLQSGLVP